MSETWISVAEARRAILSAVPRIHETERVELAAALDRVLAVELAAPFDVPPLDNSAVDGYAITGGPPIEAGAELAVRGELKAGTCDQRPLEPGQAVHIMTGAPLPPGVDRVVPQEQVERVGARVSIPAGTRSGSNIRRAGEDIRRGSIVLAAGTRLRPATLGVLAALGQAEVEVVRRPRVALLSTGDEIRAPGSERARGQIYDINRYSLGACLRRDGTEVVELGIVGDDAAALARALLEGARGCDALVTSGGVSVGPYDLLKRVLAELGTIEFWQVRMTPGRPLAFGRIGATPLFGLPGNPVAALISHRLFLRPALEQLAGAAWRDPPRFAARAAERMFKKPGRLELKRGILSADQQGWSVRTTGPQGSGILTSMVRADCLIVLEEQRGPVEPGEQVQVELLEL